MCSSWKALKKPISYLLLVSLFLNGGLFLWKSVSQESQHSVEKTLNRLLFNLHLLEIDIENGRRNLGSSDAPNFPPTTKFLTDQSIPSLSTFPAHVAKQPMNSDSSDLKLVKEEKSKSTKERFNYASFECAATILKVNPQAKGARALLLESKDQYMWNECDSEKHVVVELCDDILVDTVALANYEFFSSVFKDIKISVSDLYPPKASTGWKVLGEFQARNVRDIQVFHIDNPLIWARFIRIDFLSHYGNEFVCPVSLLRVHGTTMIEEYRRGDDDLPPEPPKALPAEVVHYALPALEAEPTTSLPRIQVPLIANFESTTSDAGLDKLKEVTVIGASSSDPQPSPSGGTQESIFKTIMKRLSALEQSMSLSYQYFSEQSTAINDAFSDIDTAQKEYLRDTLVNLNETTMAQLNLLRNTYEVIWQTAMHETKLYRENTNEQIEEITRQVHILADEVLFEKRLGVVQLLLLMVLIVIVGSSNLIRGPLRLMRKERVD